MRGRTFQSSNLIAVKEFYTDDGETEDRHREVVWTFLVSVAHSSHTHSSHTQAFTQSSTMGHGNTLSQRNNKCKQFVDMLGP